MAGQQELLVSHPPDTAKPNKPDQSKRMDFPSRGGRGAHGGCGGRSRDLFGGREKRTKHVRKSENSAL